MCLYHKDVFMYDSSGNIVNVENDKLVVLQGLKDYIVVQNEDVILVCRRVDEQKIKQFVTDIKTEVGDDMPMQNIHLVINPGDLLER